MGKKFLPGQREHGLAVEWARFLNQREARGPGDLDNARARIEARYGLPAQVLWRLRYKPDVFDIPFDTFIHLRNTYLAFLDDLDARTARRRAAVLQPEQGQPLTRPQQRGDLTRPRSLSPPEAAVAAG